MRVRLHAATPCEVLRADVEESRNCVSGKKPTRRHDGVDRTAFWSDTDLIEKNLPEFA